MTQPHHRHSRKPKEDTASQIALYFVKLLTTVCIIPLIAVALGWNNAQECLEVLKVLLPYLTTLVGFVAGYYFPRGQSGKGT